MAPAVEKLVDGFILAEGPFWDVQSEALYFVDIRGKTLHRYDAITKKHTQVSVAPKRVSFIIPVAGTKDNFVIGLQTSIAIIHWDGKSDEVQILKTLESIEEPTAFNDAKCDSSGRLWTGTFVIDFNNLDATEPLGSLYRLESGKKLQPQLKDIKISNGIEWNENYQKMYYIDSLKDDIKQYDYDLDTGNISNERSWFSLKKLGIPGLPDGMTVDSEGNLWVAACGGGRVLKIDGSRPHTLLQTIELPSESVTSVTFGGKNLDELYVTTGDFDVEEVPQGTPKGALYRVTGVGAKGVPANEFSLD